LPEVKERFSKPETLLWFCAGLIHQIPARHKLQNNETEASACGILAIALIENRHYVRVTNLVKDRAFAPKFLAEHLLKLWIRSSVKMAIQSLDHNNVSAIASNEYLGVTAGANPTFNLVAILEDRSLKIQFRH